MRRSGRKPLGKGRQDKRHRLSSERTAASIRTSANAVPEAGAEAGKAVEHAIRLFKGALRDGGSVRAPLPGGGELRLDRALPFLLVHRDRPDSSDRATPRLVRTESAALVWRAKPDTDPLLRELVRRIAEIGTAAFGSFLILEIWCGRDRNGPVRILGPETEDPGTVGALTDALIALRELRPTLRVEVLAAEDRAPPRATPLLGVSECYDLGCLLLGVELPPVYIQPVEDRRPYPVFFRRFRAAFSRAVRRAAFEFIRVQTDAHVANFRMLGPARVDDAVWAADARLAEIDASFDLLLLLSPVDQREPWEEFRASGNQRPPNFRYRLLPVDPDVLKRQLYAIELEEIDDPTLLYLLADKRDELDRKISLLADRNSRSFVHASMRLYGTVDEHLLAQAHEILGSVPAPSERSRNGWVDAEAFRRKALREIASYRIGYPELRSHVQVRRDVRDLMVSSGNLLIGESVLLDPRRIEALLHHEVGTHVLTYYNGRAQPLRQLATGLADYDELQEGLAVMSEFLAGGLTSARLRVLAARVVAAHSVERGAELPETFGLLRREHGFSARTAFDISVRVHQSGGYTRDLIYLRGLLRLMDYLRTGGAVEPLFIGKLARKHIAPIGELIDRGVLRPPPLRPRVLDLPESADRLEAVRRGLPVTGLIRDDVA